MAGGAAGDLPFDGSPCLLLESRRPDGNRALLGYGPASRFAITLLLGIGTGMGAPESPLPGAVRFEYDTLHLTRILGPQRFEHLAGLQFCRNADGGG